ncbi:4-hydroxythreonine-4-phosphate dehydrogenase PdxA [Candidatus Chrysopegis kryptomonas]|uniref:4-hydroxythreonine-4-phosphate dehydrogenase n=1 Tax=Candidatus Chryseopegocella kryptomonas TaxID=1633643 RepID=A0A0P1MMM5_9BACT|nr:4-hydroxythreonine-4-phosphate dehydrogenase PdxA [Candidatus Chrysopegis kryptomonas]CUS96288.1 4-hydroxythreonine-4-phosphate dehydrogenase [Candidatus Chrysopegis kryptomonas]
MSPKIAVTIGDINGIGPEVALKAVVKKSVLSVCDPFIIAPFKLVNIYSPFLGIKLHVMENEDDFERGKNLANIYPMREFKNVKITLGQPSKISGQIAGESIEIAVEMCLNGKASAVCTSPVSKKSLNLAGFNFPGQTEMIAHLSNSKRYLMMFINNKIKLALATIHIPLSKVSKTITHELLAEKIEILIETLKKDFLINSPSIAVLGLNPHAGEDGLIGDEEKKIIKPVIEKFSAKNFKIDGPFSADGFFGEKKFKNYDAILSMYHDQGLIPVKLIDFYNTVNFSAGLNIVRTSPDHGTAYDIAGRLIANEKSMVQAIILSAKIYKNRANFNE